MSAHEQMTVEVRLFAGARQRVGHELVRVELAAPATIADLRAALTRDYPRLADLLPRALFAIEMHYVTDATPVEPTRPIACIPPVSGG